MTTREEVMAKYSQELALNTDLHAIMHILTAPPARDDSEAEWQRVLDMDSAWVGFQNKYPQEMLDDLEQGLNDAIDVITEKLNDGDYGDDI
jgi:hypothetical protein